MTVKCPECALMYAYIDEAHATSDKLVFKNVKCRCGNNYQIAYKTGSRHQFNSAALPTGMEHNVHLLGRN